MTKAMVTINPEINMGVLAGIITGLVAGAVYNRWAGIKLPDFLSFFGGKRFVPIATGFFCLILAAIFGYVWPPVQHAIHSGGEWIVSAGALGSGIFGFINRLLIPTGLHQVLNTIAWFQIGEFTNAAGAVFHGDINRFYAGDGTAGMFMSGFFPIMMFGLPGAALAMYLAAPKARRPMVGGMLLSVAITAFLTGVTEPLEFLFMFLAPLLYLLHAVLTGISLFIATALGIHAGFSFSAGAIDYVLMYSLPAASKNVWMLLVMGVVFFFVYFLLFSAVIRMFNLKTPGREDKAADVVTEEANSNTEEGLTQLATSYIAAVGGTDNLKAIDACITRLRLTVGDSAKVNDAACKRLGASGVVKLNKQTIQVIVGAKAESIGDEMKKVVTRGPVAAAAAAAAPAGNVATAAPAAKPQAVANAKIVESLVSPITGDVVALEQVPDEAFASKAVGDGIAVKPTSNIVVAPAAGTVVKIFNTNHAFCLETNNGAEIVVHMGIDTVALEGKGFKRLVEEGTDVKAGEPILEMDLDFLNANARSMISPVVCSNSDDYSALVILASGKVVAGQTPLYEIKGK
ncbi:PTS system N-acetylglucosamine-specific transporter subunit IIA [Klebsiella pneumoniae]|nr:PTS system N-acetylglucosamine-specific transporter subunit IIA [Klebsiella pneumoniae]